jgi:hypothetical protein
MVIITYITPLRSCRHRIPTSRSLILSEECLPVLLIYPFSIGSISHTPQPSIIPENFQQIHLFHCPLPGSQVFITLVVLIIGSVRFPTLTTCTYNPMFCFISSSQRLLASLFYLSPISAPSVIAIWYQTLLSCFTHILPHKLRQVFSKWLKMFPLILDARLHYGLVPSSVLYKLTWFKLSLINSFLLISTAMFLPDLLSSTLLRKCMRLKIFHRIKIIYVGFNLVLFL